MTLQSGWATHHAGARTVLRTLLALASVVLITVSASGTAQAVMARFAAGKDRTAPTTAQAAATSPLTWSGPSAIPSARTYDGGPALAKYDGMLYAAWQGQSSPYHIWYSTFDGTSWSTEAEVPNAETNEYTGPTLAVYGGSLFLAWQGASSPHNIWYASFNGTKWTSQAKVPNALVNTSSAVGMAAHGGNLYLAWAGQSSPYDLWYSSFNGTSWTAQARIPSATSTGVFAYAASPLASYAGLLYVAWPTGSNGELEYATFDGSWSAPVSLGGGGVLSEGGPALAVMGSKLYETWASLSDQDVYWASFNGASWSTPKAVPHSETIVNPGLAGYSGALYDAWTPDIEGSPIDYSVHS
jgi:hypothetical protein